MIKHRIACPADFLGLRWIVFKRRPRLLSRNDKSCGQAFVIDPPFPLPLLPPTPPLPLSLALSPAFPPYSFFLCHFFFSRYFSYSFSLFFISLALRRCYVTYREMIQLFNYSTNFRIRHDYHGDQVRKIVYGAFKLSLKLTQCTGQGFLMTHRSWYARAAKLFL